MGSLTGAEREAMRALMARHFRGVTPRSFAADLDEKESAVLLYGEAGEIVGFSTLLRMEASGATAFFSGDTVVEAQARGLAALPRLWSRHVFALARRHPKRETYWFLISSGYATYRFLPTFFRRFVPAPEASGGPASGDTASGANPSPETEREAALLRAFAATRFGERFDPASGVVRLAHPTPLREGVAEVTAHRRADPHVAFFLQKNPGHARGDELACLTRVHPANLTPAGRRMVGPDLAAPLAPLP